MCGLPCREPPLEKSDDTLALEEQRDTDSDGVLTNDDSSLPDLELEPLPNIDIRHECQSRGILHSHFVRLSTAAPGA